MSNVVGLGLDRTDGAVKVTGRARYSGDVQLPNMAYVWMVQSTIAKGRIVGMDTDKVKAMPGVIAVINSENAERLPKVAISPPAIRALNLLQDDVVTYNHQPIALVVAESLEQARDAANHLNVRYASEPGMVDFEKAKLDPFKPPKVSRSETDSSRGDMAAGKAAATTTVQAVYTTPIEHHNPMEPHGTVASWADGVMTLYDSTQGVSGTKAGVAKFLGIDPDKVVVICPFVGGGFGSKGTMWSHVPLAAMATRHVGRPIKMVLDRTQMFGPLGNRPHTEQAMYMGATADGKLTAVDHAVIAETSTIEDWPETSALVTRMLYSSDAMTTSHRLARMNVATPTFTRAPGEASGTFALEGAMDEMAVALKMDPVKFRLINYAETDLGEKKPFSSKSLRQCYEQAGERFGWGKRNPLPGSMRDGHWRVGMGMASATYPTNRSPAQADVFITPDGMAVVRSGTQDLGTGAYTVMTQVSADALGFPMRQVRFELGDSRLPPAPASGGSQSTASVSPAVQAACLQARRQLLDLAINDAASPLYGRARDELTIVDARVQVSADASRGEPVAALVKRSGMPVHAQAQTAPGPEKQAYSMNSFGAVFAEVRVDEDLGIVRVPRVVGAYGVGNILNAKTAHSQLMGGIVWGIGMALFEETVRDTRTGRYVNGSLAEYHVPVNADIGSIEVIVVPETDTLVNPLGVKGIGEIGITGVAAAIGNAIFHATGRRIRELPMTLDKVMGWADV